MAVDHSSSVGQAWKNARIAQAILNMKIYNEKRLRNATVSKSKPVGIDGRPMGFTGQDMQRPCGGIATREQQQQWMNAMFDCFFENHGSITLNELRIMRYIVEAHDRGRPISPSDLGYELGVPITTVSRIVSRLVNRGKITSKRLANDRRRKVLLPTPRLLERRKKGHTELAKMMMEIWGWKRLHLSDGKI